MSDRNWLIKLEAVNRTSDDQMEQRLKLLAEQQEELDDLILTDAEAYVDMKHDMESNIAVMSDQIQFLEAIHQMNEVRTTYSNQQGGTSLEGARSQSLPTVRHS